MLAGMCIVLLGLDELWTPTKTPELAVAVVAVAILSALLSNAMKFASSGTEGLSELGVTLTSLNPHGEIRVGDSIWPACSEKPIGRNQPVRVLGRSGRVLFVEQTRPRRGD